MKKVKTLLILVVIVVLGIVFVPRLVHKCDSCGDWIIGTGYEPAALVELVDSEQEVICKDCAETQHAIEVALGSSVSDFKRPLFD